MNIINYVEITPNRYQVYVDEDHIIGDFIRDVDGYFYFQQDEMKGLWAAYSLRWIADKLDEINKPYNDMVLAYFTAEQLKDNNPGTEVI